MLGCTARILTAGQFNAVGPMRLDHSHERIHGLPCETALQFESALRVLSSIDSYTCLFHSWLDLPTEKFSCPVGVAGS